MKKDNFIYRSTNPNLSRYTYFANYIIIYKSTISAGGNNECKQYRFIHEELFIIKSRSS